MASRNKAAGVAVATVFACVVAVAVFPRELGIALLVAVVVMLVVPIGGPLPARDKGDQSVSPTHQTNGPQGPAAAQPGHVDQVATHSSGAQDDAPLLFAETTGPAARELVQSDVPREAVDRGVNVEHDGRQL